MIDIMIRTTSLECPFGGIGQDMCDYALSLQDTIVSHLSDYEPNSVFKTDIWDRPGGGGGRTCVIEDGLIFEKGGVNVSAVEGLISTPHEVQMFQQLLQQQNRSCPLDNAHFFATGISLVLHPRHPLVPIVHMNYRYFEMRTQQHTIWWFGGGTD